MRKVARMGMSLTEVLVAMVVVAVGVLGLSMVMTRSIKGGRGTELYQGATQLAQLKISELKRAAQENWAGMGTRTEVPGDDDLTLGRAGAQMIIEMQLNSQGNTKGDQLDREIESGGACSGVALGSNPDQAPPECQARLEELGPYVFTRAFVICLGADYDTNGTYAYDYARPEALTQVIATAEQSAVRGAISLDCLMRVNADGTDVGQTRSRWLTCGPQDISAPPGPTNPEKVAKVLVSWRTQEGECHSVNLSANLPSP